jgi:metallo-beta-lactamase family protein
MCDAGRIRHHLKYNLWRPCSSVVFVGYQALGSLGRRILDGAEEVKLFGETVAVRAEIVRMPGMSSHADRSRLLAWARAFSPKPRHVFVVHGDAEVAPAFAEALTREGFDAHAPKYCEEYDLDALRVAREGVEPEKPKPAAYGGFKDSPAYTALVELGKKLMEVIGHNRGGANRDLKKFAGEIEKLIAKWDR